MPKGKKLKSKPKLKLKTMTDEILDRLDHVEDVLEDHANCGMRNDNQIAALEEAICPRVAARLTALERSTKALTEQIEMFQKTPATAQNAAPPPKQSDADDGVRVALYNKMGLIFSQDEIQAIREAFADYAY